MIDRAHPTLSISRQCHLLEVSRASVYRRPAPVSADDLRLMELIDRQYLARPFYGGQAPNPIWPTMLPNEVKTFCIVHQR
jgi:putative transposase